MALASLVQTVQNVGEQSSRRHIVQRCEWAPGILGYVFVDARVCVKYVMIEEGLPSGPMPRGKIPDRQHGVKQCRGRRGARRDIGDPPCLLYTSDAADE